MISPLRFAAIGLASALAVQPAHASLPDPVRAMIEAALASGDEGDVETVAKLAKATNPDDAAEVDAMLATWRAARDQAGDAAEELAPDPVQAMLDAAIASRKDSDVEAVAKLAKAARPDDAAAIDARVAAYRDDRAKEKEREKAAAHAKLASAKFWQNWKGEGQIGASHSSGNNSSTGLSLGVALTRKGLDWDQRFRAQGDYQRSDGKTTIERYLAEYEPQIRIGDRAFAFGLGRWERDRMAGYSARWNASGGLGYKLIDEGGMSLSLKAGPAWRRTDFIAGADDGELTGLGGLDFAWQLSPTLRLTQTASTIVGETTTTTSSLTALNAKLTGALSARVAYSADLDTHPPAGVDQLDTLTRFTLVYGF